MPDVEDNEVSSQPQEFASLLLSLNKGATHDELSEKFAQVAAAVVETRKPGSLTLTLKVEPVKKTDEAMVYLLDDIKTKVPALDRKSSVFYVNDAGRLSKDHPGQTSMFSIQGEATR